MQLQKWSLFGRRHFQFFFYKYEKILINLSVISTRFQRNLLNSSPPSAAYMRQ